MLRLSCICCSVIAFLAMGPALATAETVTFDFSDDFATPLTNGAAVNTPAAFGNVFNLSSSGPNLGSAIFDSTPAGPNAATGDSDLLLDTGNILILQSNNAATQTVSGVFDTPNDSSLGGIMSFDFAPANFAVELQSIDVLDIDLGTTVAFTLTDSMNRTRRIYLGHNFTGDIMNGDIGMTTVDFGGAEQESPNIAGLFSDVTDQSGFDLADIATLEIEIEGSAAIDNLVFVPEPTTGLLMMCGLVGLARRRR